MFRKEVRYFESYETMKGDHRIWLDKNESPFDIPDELKDRIFDELKKIEFNRYPDISGLPLREKLATHLSLDVSNIVVGNGSDQLIDGILDLFVGNQVVIHSPTFGMYSFYAKKKGLELVDIPLDEDHDLPCMDSYGDDVKVIFICSPNTPTGNMISRDKIVDVLEKGYPVVLDEAYIDFARGSNIDLVEEYENLIVLRTLSKAYGLAAMRVGYAVAQPSVMLQLSKIVSPFIINKISMKMAEMMLEQKELIRERVEYIKNEREKLISEFSEYAYPSETNFVMLDLDAYEYLLEQGIVVRKLDGRLKGKIRVTVGTVEENREVTDALKDFLCSQRC